MTTPTNVLWLGNLPPTADRKLVYELGIQVGPAA